MQHGSNNAQCDHKNQFNCRSIDKAFVELRMEHQKATEKRAIIELMAFDTRLKAIRGRDGKK